MNYKMMGRLIAQILLAEAAFMVPALIISLVGQDSQAILGFALSILVILAVAGMLMFFARKAKKGFYAREGMVCVGLAWIVMSLLGCLPFWISREIPSYLDGLFEIVSGFTTTGASILSLFDNVSEVLHDRVNAKDIQPMTDRDYTVRGCTALLDAIGGAVHHIGNVHKYARPEDVPEHTMFVITTDGMENASRRYTYEKVKQMIERQKTKYNWEFLFLGANIDAVQTAGQLGIGADRAVNYQCDSEGTALNYDVVSAAISSVRCSASLSADWKKRIDEDYKKRGGRRHK